MRIGESSLSQAAKNIVLDANQFESGLLDEKSLQNLALDPTSIKSRDVLGTKDNPLVAGTLQRNAVALAQSTHALAADLQLTGFDSLGQGALESILKIVGQETFLNDSDVRALAIEGVESIIDFVVDGPLSAIPFVGAAARVVWSTVQLVFESTKLEPGSLPPMFRMSPAADDRDTNIAINRLKGQSGDDWTPIFLPRTRGRWGMVVESGPEGRASGSAKFARDPAPYYDKHIPRLGCAPGDLFYVDGGVQARVTTGDVTIPSKSREPQYQTIMGTGNNPRALHSLVFGLSSWYPSLSSLGRSVWSLIGVRESTAMFQVDADQIADEWAQFAGATGIFRAHIDEHLTRRIPKGSKDFKRPLIANYLANVGAAMHTLRTRDEKGKLRELNQDQLLAAALDPGKRAGADSVGRRAVVHANNLLKRQRQTIQTPLNALVSANAPAFRTNPALREFLLAERTKMLNAGRFDDLVLEEVPDPHLRKRISTRGRPPGGSMSTNFVDPASAERQRKHAAELSEVLKKVDKPVGFGGYGAEHDPEDESGGGFGLAIAGLVATAGLAAGGVALARRRRR
ncbi:MAG: hypothetical protein ACRBN8_19735 [Nannocystales bacterium]